MQFAFFYDSLCSSLHYDEVGVEVGVEVVVDCGVPDASIKGACVSLLKLIYFYFLFAPCGW